MRTSVLAAVSRCSNTLVTLLLPPSGRATKSPDGQKRVSYMLSLGLITRTHSQASFLGPVSWPHSQASFLGHVSWPHSQASFLGHVSWPHSQASFLGHVSWPHSQASFLGHVSSGEEGETVSLSPAAAP